MNATIVIPARIESSRLPKKVLSDIGGKTLIQRVVNQCMITGLETYVITDSFEVYESVRDTKVKVVLQQAEASSGTERISNVMTSIPGEKIINVQGDQPFISPQAILEMNDHLLKENYDVVTPYKLYDKNSKYGKSQDKPKLVTSQSGKVLYFSRHPIGTDQLKIHMGIYGYTRNFLENFSQLKTSQLEETERLEQLRFLDNDVSVFSYETEHDVFSVDTPEDLEDAREIVRKL